MADIKTDSRILNGVILAFNTRIIWKNIVRSGQNIEFSFVKPVGSKPHYRVRKYKVGHGFKMCLCVHGYTCRTNVHQTFRSMDI